MRATVMYKAGDVRSETVSDSVIEQATDALVRVTATCICGSDLHPYHSMKVEDGPVRMGHEFIGVVEAIGGGVETLKKGDLVVAPFAFSDGTCRYCRRGPADVLRERQLLGRGSRGRWPGRGDPRAAR